MLTSKELLEIGVKPGELFGKLLKCNTLEEAKEKWQQHQLEKSIKTERKETEPVFFTVLDWLCENDCLKSMGSREFPDGRTASKSERRRWLESGAVIVNGEKKKPDDEMKWPVTSLVFFPSSNRITML